MAWQAQLRLCRRYKRLMQRGKHRNVVVAAIAREMLAYIWAISREVILVPVTQVHVFQGYRIIKKECKSTT